MMKKAIVFFLCLFSLIAAGCGGGSQKSVTVYTAIENDYVAEYIKLFQAKHPDIKVNIVRDSSGLIAAKLLAERDNPVADVMWGVPSSNALIMEQYNMFKPFKPNDLGLIDPQYYDQTNNPPKWVGMSFEMGALTVNVKELKAKNLPIPASYEDLVKPEYKGSIIMPNPAASGTGFYTVSGWIQRMGEQEAWKYMDKLHANIIEYSNSGSTPTNKTAQGEALIGIGMDFLSLQQQQKRPQIMTVFPAEGSGWHLEVVALINKKTISKEAEIFANWATSKEALEAYSKNRGMITLKDYTPKLAGYPKSVKEQMIKNDIRWAAENRDRILKEWEKRYGAGKK